MYPAIIADEIKTSVLEYLRTSFNLSDKDVEKQLIEFLGDQKNLGFLCEQIFLKDRKATK